MTVYELTQGWQEEVRDLHDRWGRYQGGSTREEVWGQYRETLGVEPLIRPRSLTPRKFTPRELRVYREIQAQVEREYPS